MLSTRRQSKTWPGVRIDPDHPLAQGLVAFWAFNEGAGLPYDCVGQQKPSTSTAAWTSTPYGVGLSLNGTSQSVVLGAPANLAFSGPFTVAYGGAPAAQTTQQYILDARDSTRSAGGFALTTTSGGNNLQVSLPPSNTLVTSTAPVDGNYHVYAFTLAATGAGGSIFYRDGVATGTGNSSALVVTASPLVATIGTRSSSPLSYYTGPMGWLGVWIRGLAAIEHMALQANPWQMFPEPTPYWLYHSAATTGKLIRVNWDGGFKQILDGGFAA